MSDKLPPIEELLTEFDSGKVPRSQTWHTLITGLYFNFDSVNEIEGWYNTVQELTGHNQELANTISDNHQQIEVWYGQIDSWQQQVEANKVSTSQSATMATAQATMAKAWAANPEDARVDGERYSSLHYASKSSEYADASSGNAELSRDQSMLAQQAMRNASNSEINANLSKVQAQQAATEASQSKEASGVSEQKAADSAAAAKNSETAAVGASDSALDSKNSAAGSAGTATQQADRSESEADRSEAAANRAINASSRIVGELARFSFDTPPSGFFALDGSTIPNGKNDFVALANSGSRFITVSGNDLILADAVDFGRGKGSSGRSVGSFEGDAIRYFTGSIRQSTFENYTGYGKEPEGAFYRIGDNHSGNNGGQNQQGSKIIFDPSRVVPTAPENRPKSLTELVCIYHGVI